MSEINRISWIDFARGITILLMVMGHSTIPKALSIYIWSFHMPLFFIVSGLFFEKNKRTFKQQFKHKIHTLCVPYVVFSLVVMAGYYGTEYFKPYELYLGWEGYALWFVPVLFFAEFLFSCIVLLRKSIYIYGAVLVLFLCSYALSLNNLHFPFKMESVGFALFFIASGYAMQPLVHNLHNYSWLAVIFIGGVTITLSQILPKLGVGRNDFGCVWLNPLNAILGSLFIFILSKRILNSCLVSKWPIDGITKYFIWLGRNTLFVMAFSQLFNYWILVSLNRMGVTQIWGILLRYVILFAMIGWVSKSINKYVPSIIGKKVVNQ